MWRQSQNVHPKNFCINLKHANHKCEFKMKTGFEKHNKVALYYIYI